MIQEAEGATIRIQELEHKLRLADKELAQESVEELSEFHTNQKIEDMSGELQEA